MKSFNSIKISFTAPTKLVSRFIVSLFLFLPDMAFADDDTPTPVGQGLMYIINAMYGGTGISIATVAVIAVGLLCLGHYLEWKRLFQTVVGVAIVFGAGAVVKGIKALVSTA